MTDKRYRVAQWGTGHSGMASLRALIEHPNFDLVGVYVYSDEKAGRDAGELCGIGPTGIIATRNIEDIIAAKPDCVVYMPVTYDLDDICRLLESGVNISTLLEHFHDPESLDPQVRQRIEAACQRGGTSIYSSGTSPGFVTEPLPVVLTSLQRRLDCLTINEFADMSERNSPEMMSMLFGSEPAPDRQRHRTEYGFVLRLFAAPARESAFIAARRRYRDRNGGDGHEARADRGGNLRGRYRGRVADRDQRDPRRQTPAADDPHLVHHDRPRAGVEHSFSGTGMARRGRG